MPPMAHMPLQGNLEAKGSLKGAFDEPKLLAIEVSKLNLKNFKGDLKYKSRDGTMVVEGPVSANVDGHLSSIGTKVRSAELTIFGDLTSLLVSKQGLFEKKAGEPCRVDFTAKQDEKDFAIEKSEFKLPFGTINVGGRVHDVSDPHLDLNIKADVTSIDNLKTYLASLKTAPLNGAMQAQITIKGKPVTSDPWSEWPLNITGQVRYNSPKMVLAPEAKAPVVKEGEADAAPSGAPAGPFLQRGYLTEHLDFSVDAKIGKLVKDRPSPWIIRL